MTYNYGKSLHGTEQLISVWKTHFAFMICCVNTIIFWYLKSLLRNVKRKSRWSPFNKKPNWILRLLFLKKNICTCLGCIDPFAPEFEYKLAKLHKRSKNLRFNEMLERKCVRAITSDCLFCWRWSESGASVWSTVTSCSPWTSWCAPPASLISVLSALTGGFTLYPPFIVIAGVLSLLLVCLLLLIKLQPTPLFFIPVFAIYHSPQNGLSASFVTISLFSKTK